MPHSQLIEHNQQFKKEVVRLSAGIHTAVGMAASNVHLIEGKTGITIVDTSESTRAAEMILRRFRELTDKPVKKIIYTHGHRDHIGGASVFAEDDTSILASQRFDSDLLQRSNRRFPLKALQRRTAAQFGIGLSSDERISLGCGPADRPMEGLGAGFLEPTEFLETDMRIDLDGVACDCIHAPGETPDHLTLFLPEQSVLFCGDNWYHCFPNLYAIRGTPYRDFEAWAESLDMLAALSADILAPGHTRPVFGKALVRKVLTTTAAAIRYIIEFTSNAMDAGMGMDEIAAGAHLPAELAQLRWLQEHYGKISWSAVAYASGTLGWYDGNPAHLQSLDPKERARLIAELAGGVEAVLRAAHATENSQWRLELCDHLEALGKPVGKLKIQTLRELAEAEINSPARNTYLWSAKQVAKELNEN